MPSTKRETHLARPTPSPVSQVEIESVLTIYNTAAKLAIGIRDRIAAGAPVESGQLKADNTLAGSFDDSPTRHLHIYGLDIKPFRGHQEVK